MVPYIARACLYTWILLNYPTEPGLYMEVPNTKHGCLPHRTQELYGFKTIKSIFEVIYSCGQPNTTTLISRDLDFFEAN
jgi:hypothetical protein